MKLTGYLIASHKVEITLNFGRENITYQKFGKDLFSGSNLTEGISKSNPYLQEIKTQIQNSIYFDNPELGVDSLEIFLNNQINNVKTN